MSKTTTPAKPTLANKSKTDTALAFAASAALNILPHAKAALLRVGAVPEATPAKQAAEKRAFFAPEGYRRLTINLREDLHKKLRLAAIEQDCNATDIIVRLLETGA